MFYNCCTGTDPVQHFGAKEEKKKWGFRSGVKYFLHRQSTVSITLFLAQAETAELTAVISLELMECFVPQRVRMPPGSARAARESSMQEPRWLAAAPFFACIFYLRERKKGGKKNSLSLWARLSAAPNKLHKKTSSLLSWLCINVMKGISICGCHLELSAHVKVEQHHSRCALHQNQSKQPAQS